MAAEMNTAIDPLSQGRSKLPVFDVNMCAEDMKRRALLRERKAMFMVRE